MATRRTTKVEVPIPPPSTSNGNTMKTSQADTALGSGSGSPFLPTALEAVLLAIYPITLIFGSLFSTLHPDTRFATYLPDSQSYDPRNAPSYFAKKSNIFNVWFVKIGWVWTTLAFALLIFSHSSLGPPFSLRITKRRAQAAVRYASITLIWIFVTQWFFGPAIIDRSFRWTGGQCEIIQGNTAADRAEKAEMNNFREVFTHAACKATGGTWRGGHDISGHVFLLILSSAMLWLELLPAILGTQGLGEARRIRTQDGLNRSAALESGDRLQGTKDLGIGGCLSLAVAGFSWWMLLMTAAYFHTWFEKLTGLLVAFGSIYMVYFLPRAIPALRKTVGMPGV